VAIPSSLIIRIVQRTLTLVTCYALFSASTCQARNGDDYVLVERFQSQQKLAQAGNASAMYEVGRMYELGRGTQPSIDKAIQWYERALHKGQNNAGAQLGVIYFEGNSVKRDLHKAFKLLDAAAKGGSATAQFYLGQMYEQGEGVQRNLNLSKHWYQKASDNGNYRAVARLKTLEHAPASSRQAAAPAIRSNPSDSPAAILLQTVLNTKWQRNGRPTGFLPSANTKCSQKANRTVSCQSGEQKRNTGDAIIVYVTEATLSGFGNSDQFVVNYYNNVHKIQPVARPGLDGETTTPRPPPNIKLGKQSMIHKLRCELQSVDRLVCVKDNSSTDTYTRAK